MTQTSLPTYLREQAYQYRLDRIKRAQTVDPIEWIEKHFYIPETSAPIVLVPYQKAVIREALAKDDGLFRYSLVLWSDLKKSAKSTIAGAMALYLAWHTAWESVRIVGNDLKQADSRTFFYIERAIRMNPLLAKQCSIKSYEIKLPNHTVIAAVPVDPKGEAGGGDLATVFTEMWAMKNKASQQMWSETTLSPLKFGKSIRIGESYAGIKGESPILEPLYEQATKEGEVVDVGIDGLELYRKNRFLCLWNTTPRCDWQTPEYYEQEATSLVPSEFQRMHRNQWADSHETFIPIEWWDGCQRELEDMGTKRSVVIALDAAVTNDCFALVAVSTVMREGVKHVQVRYCRIWTPPVGGEIKFVEIEDELRRLLKVYNVICITYDPMQLADMAQRLAGLAWWYKFDQQKPRAIADKRLYDMIRDRHVEHNGDVDLRQHILNADREKADDNKLRIVKRAPEKKIDALVALSMGNDRAMELQF